MCVCCGAFPLVCCCSSPLCDVERVCGSSHALVVGCVLHTHTHGTQIKSQQHTHKIPSPHEERHRHREKQLVVSAVPSPNHICTATRVLRYKGVRTCWEEERCAGLALGEHTPTPLSSAAISIIIIIIIIIISFISFIHLSSSSSSSACTRHTLWAIACMWDICR